MAEKTGGTTGCADVARAAGATGAAGAADFVCGAGTVVSFTADAARWGDACGVDAGCDVGDVGDGSDASTGADTGGAGVGAGSGVGAAAGRACSRGCVGGCVGVRADCPYSVPSSFSGSPQSPRNTLPKARASTRALPPKISMRRWWVAAWNLGCTWARRISCAIRSVRSVDSAGFAAASFAATGTFSGPFSGGGSEWGFAEESSGWGAGASGTGGTTAAKTCGCLGVGSRVSSSAGSGVGAEVGAGAGSGVGSGGKAGLSGNSSGSAAGLRVRSGNVAAGRVDLSSFSAWVGVARPADAALSLLARCKASSNRLMGASLAIEARVWQVLVGRSWHHALLAACCETP